jgi:HUS1 checkpoint protein
MRWKAHLRNAELLLKVVNATEKMGKECVVHLSRDQIQFVRIGELSDGVQVWTSFKIGTVFDAYRIESLNDDNIALTLKLEHLARALKSAAASSAQVECKLAKRDSQPVMHFAISLMDTDRISYINHDVPIRLLSAGQLEQLVEPDVPDPDVHIVMPPLKLVRNVVERMKNMSDVLTIEANMDGMLMLSIDTELVTVSTFYRNLIHLQIQGKPPPVRDASVRAQVKVDIKKFSRFLASHLVNPSTVICSILPDRSLVLYVMVSDLFITYYIPLLNV